MCLVRCLAAFSPLWSPPPTCSTHSTLSSVDITAWIMPSCTPIFRMLDQMCLRGILSNIFLQSHATTHEPKPSFFRCRRVDFAVQIHAGLRRRGKKVKVGSGAGRCLGNPADSDRGARQEMAGHSECLARSGGRAVGAQLKNGEETVVTNDVHVAVRERYIPLWIGSGGGRRRAQDATGVVYL